MSKKAVNAEAIEPRKGNSVYPEPFGKRVEGRTKRKLGDYFGLENFGVNLTSLNPGSISALQHVHAVQDEFIYVVSGQPTLILGDTRQRLAPGMVIGFPAGGEAHQIVNESDEIATFLEIGDRMPGDSATYPHEDLVALVDDSGKWHFTHKDGTPY